MFHVENAQLRDCSLNINIMFQSISSWGCWLLVLTQVLASPALRVDTAVAQTEIIDDADFTS